MIRTLLVTAVLAALASRSVVAQDAPAVLTRDAVLFEDRLVALRDDGRLVAWRAESDELDARFPAAPDGARLLSSEPTKLWCATRTSIWTLSGADATWDRVADFEAKDEEPQALAVVDGKPFLVFGRSVLSPTGPREFEVPPGKGQLTKLRDLRVHAVLGAGQLLWIGTGYGEWGGELLGLHVQAGTWVESTDDHYYVTGLAVTGSGDIAAMWAMSHFRAKMVLRTHATDVSLT
jgi:hypothetical protein